MSTKNNNSTVARTDIPKRGLAGLKENWKSDLIAGFSVSLIALPLCLGIAKASEFPAIAGVFTAIVGGLLASRLCGSFVTISGPAAGLIAINVAAVTTLGGVEKDPITGNAFGYPYALAAIVVAGLFVVLFGLLKVGKLSDFFPTAAVHGMLAAIGIIIIIKQSFFAIGVPAPKGELLEVAAQLPAALLKTNPIIAFIAGMSLLLLIIYPRIKNKWIKLVPAPMWVLLMTIPMTFIYDILHEHAYVFAGKEFSLSPSYLVSLPAKITDGIVFPNFSKVASSEFWIAVMTIALVSGLESMLSAKAVDTLDPWKRKSNLNKDLVALGAGSSAAAAIGGLPMISEIVRSSANITNGARSPWANFFHGGFLLIFLFLLKDVIMDIPNAALAAMLIFTGFRLASPKEFKHMAEIGWKQMVVFLTTIAMVLVIDLLVGIAAGVVMEMLLNFASGGKLSNFIKAQTTVETEGNRSQLRISGSLTFTNYLSLKKQINKLEASEIVILNFYGCNLIDHTVMSNLTDLQSDFKANGRQLVLQDLDSLNGLTHHALAPRRKSKDGEAAPQQLSKRQMELMQFAMQQRIHFVPETWEDNEEWSGFPSTSGKAIVRVTSVFERKNHGHHLTVADVILRTGALLTLEEEQSTMLRIDLPELRIPEFALTKETQLDKFAGRFGAQDIDFEDFPTFSDNFLLVGKDEAAIREHFTPELLSFHESHLNYFVESRGNALLVTLSDGVVRAEVIEDLLRFGKELCSMVLKEEVAQ